jgi:hypothetical protein
VNGETMMMTEDNLATKVLNLATFRNMDKVQKENAK